MDLCVVVVLLILIPFRKHAQSDETPRAPQGPPQGLPPAGTHRDLRLARDAPHADQRRSLVAAIQSLEVLGITKILLRFYYDSYYEFHRILGF